MHSPDSAKRWLRAIGTSGSVLALAILGASMLLRLTTIFGTDGQAISTLPPTQEYAIRLIHRLAASGVGLLAVGAVILCWIRRPLPAYVLQPISCSIAATVILALIGPLTPGYRVAAVTIANVVGGMGLLMAFWWLRESVAARSSARKPVEPLLRAALLVFVAHIATGAAASAYAMHGLRALAFLHLGSALLSTMFIGACLWDRRGVRSVAAATLATAGILAIQLAMGVVLLSLEARPVWLAFAHAALSPLLAIGLVSMAVAGPATLAPAAVT